MPDRQNITTLYTVRSLERQNVLQKCKRGARAPLTAHYATAGLHCVCVSVRVYLIEGHTQSIVYLHAWKRKLLQIVSLWPASLCTCCLAVAAQLARRGGGSPCPKDSLSWLCLCVFLGASIYVSSNVPLGVVLFAVVFGIGTPLVLIIRICSRHKTPTDPFPIARLRSSRDLPLQNPGWRHVRLS